MGLELETGSFKTWFWWISSTFWLEGVITISWASFHLTSNPSKAPSLLLSWSACFQICFPPPKTSYDYSPFLLTTSSGCYPGPCSMFIQTASLRSHCSIYRFYLRHDTAFTSMPAPPSSLSGSVLTVKVWVLPLNKSAGLLPVVDCELSQYEITTSYSVMSFLLYRGFNVHSNRSPWLYHSSFRVIRCTTPTSACGKK